MMGRDEIQAGKPDPADNKPTGPPAPASKDGDDNPFRLPDAPSNPIASFASFLSVLSLIPLVMCGLGIWRYRTQGPGPTLMFLWDYLEPVLGPTAVLFGILAMARYVRKPADGGIACAIFAIVAGILISLLALFTFALRHSEIGFSIAY
jgi:amino acid transporter